jgi:hypothetical protein
MFGYLFTKTVVNLVIKTKYGRGYILSDFKKSGHPVHAYQEKGKKAETSSQRNALQVKTFEYKIRFHSFRLPCSASFPGRPEGDVMIEIF